jgi:hypothetical protein
MAVAHDSRDLSIVPDDQDYSLADNHATGRLLVRPIATPEDVRANFEAFQKLKLSLLDPKTDIQVYTDSKGNQTKRIKKSGCKKIATAFGLDVKPVKRTVDNLSDGGVFVEYTVEAFAPNGRVAVGIGGADTSEGFYASRKNHKLQDVYATAFTRAANRAVLDLVGGGEVSAEEISDDEPNLPGRRPLPKPWVDKLVALAKEMPDGVEALAQYVFEEIGPQYLSKDEIARVADKLQKRKANLGKIENPPATQTNPIQPAAKDKAKEKAPAAPAGPQAGPAPSPATTLDPTTRERMHRASWIEAATQVVTVSPFSKFVGITGEQFNNASLIIAAGRDLVELAEAAHIESFSAEAKRRFNGQLKTQDQIFSAALHVLAEWCENHPADTIFPDTEIIDSEDAPVDPDQDEEDDLNGMPF